jgi:hypothetical protein
MKLTIIGDGSFGSFMKELLAPHFDICDDAEAVCVKNFGQKTMSHRRSLITKQNGLTPQPIPKKNRSDFLWMHSIFYEND